MVGFVFLFFWGGGGGGIRRLFCFFNLSCIQTYDFPFFFFSLLGMVFIIMNCPAFIYNISIIISVIKRQGEDFLFLSPFHVFNISQQQHPLSNEL